MNYYIKEYYGDYYNASSKAKNDLIEIFEEYGLKAFPIKCKIKLYENKWKMALWNLLHQAEIIKNWNNAIKCLKPGDALVIQYPPKNKPLTWNKNFKSLKKRGVKTIVFVHDFETLRNIAGGTAIKVYRAMESSILKNACKIVLHNDKMIQCASDEGFAISNRAVSLELFDYLIPNFNTQNNISHKDVHNTVIIAGNLSEEKANYIYQLPENVYVNLYGVKYKENDKSNLRYFGSFQPDELPNHLAGDYGLVWDGNSIETCAGSNGEYLRINNPHKTSLYLACGMPVIVWKYSAVADFVRKYNVGITVESLNELKSRISEVTDEEYREMKANADELSLKLRSGYFTKSALDKALNK